MCGIAGIDLLPGSETSEDLALNRMLDLIRHRGPDDRGDFQTERWRLGMTRLSILDPAHGRQPMTSANGRWVIVLNGEIYNFRSLRDGLRSRGVVFRTGADTEVLIELIAERGVVKALESAEGMFAFAALDTRSGDLWLARDRFGEKPLYLDRRENRFAFCSELSPLLIARSAPRDPSARGVISILRYGHPWPGITAIEGIEELLPGRWMRRSADGTEAHGVYWQPPTSIDHEAGSLAKCGARLLELLDQSVRDRLVADVPLGLFLSGGIDSGAVAASASRSRPDIRAVTVGFAGQRADERPMARLTAGHLGITLEEEEGVRASFSPAVFDDFLMHYGQPFHDTSAMPTRAVSAAARRHFKVVLSGDGGDELLSGYLSHERQALLQRWGGGRPGGFLSALAARGLPGTARWEGVKRALELNASRSQGLLHHTMHGVFTDQALIDLTAGTSWEADTRAQLEIEQEKSREICVSAEDPDLAVSLYALHTSLPQDILTKVDRMSMAESLEVRAPFLDSRLATYALSLPTRLKRRGKLGKYVLREALRDRLPAAIVEGPKQGFNLPVRSWLGESFWRELRGEMDDYLKDSAAELNPKLMDRYVRADTDLSRTANSYRALHRSVLIYGFLRWRKHLLRPGTGDASPVAAGERQRR